jgi:putative glutamine amidotransferase
VEPKPRIGITCSPLRAGNYYDAYLRAIESAGAEPVVMAPAAEELDAGDAHRMLSGLDGLLMPGGWDVDPAEYGEARDGAEEDVDPALDRTEIALVRGAVNAGMPVFGICRGQQVINVALGGSLMQHIDGHDMHGQPRNRLAHGIDIDPDSELAHVVSESAVMVNSLHHQAVKDLAPGLRATARSADGIVEAVESADGMVMAVQCHPEELVNQQSWAQSLFQRFVARSGARAPNGDSATGAAIAGA